MIVFGGNAKTERLLVSNWLPLHRQALSKVMTYQPPSSTFAFLTYTTLVAAAILGGGTDKWLILDSILILGSLPLFGWATVRIVNAELDQFQLWGIAAAIAIVAVQAIQLVPLPPAIWTELPGRASVVGVYEAASMDLPWHPISMTPSATLFGLIACLPALAVFFAILTMSPQETETVAYLIATLAVACALLGMAQIALGPLNFLRYQLPGESFSPPIGFFANRNHTASFLAIGLLFLGWAATRSNAYTASRLVNPSIAIVIGFALCAIVLFLTLSRGGIVLGVLAIVSSALLIFHSRRQISPLLSLGISGAVVVSSLIIVQFGLIGLLSRFEKSSQSTNTRIDVTERTLQLASGYGPLGSGYGSFPVVYAMQERGDEVRPTFMNQAHNDWAQLFQEGGLAGLAVAMGLLIWIVQTALNRRRAWESVRPQRSALVTVAALAAGIALLHSFFDYPLKTLAHQCVFAACCGIICLKATSKHRPSHGPFRA